MEKLHKFFALSLPDRRLLIRSVCLVGLVRTGLWLLPFRVLWRLLAKFEPQSSAAPAAEPMAVKRICWAIRLTSRYIPSASCLTQALAAKVLLRRRGHAAKLRIGVAKGNAGNFEAHAWIEVDGRAVIGGSDSRLKRYTGLPEFRESQM